MRIGSSIRCSTEKYSPGERTVMAASADMRTAGNPSARGRGFRGELLTCPGRRADELFELTGALLRAEGPVHTLVGLCLAPEHGYLLAGAQIVLRRTGASRDAGAVEIDGGTATATGDTTTGTSPEHRRVAQQRPSADAVCWSFVGRDQPGTAADTSPDLAFRWSVSQDQASDTRQRPRDPSSTRG
jgi:hypothetical protein